MIVVADASPLRYLVLIGDVNLLPALYGFVLTPPAVMSELSREQTPEEVRRWAAEPPAWLRIQAPAGAIPVLSSTLGAGEVHALALASELSADLLLIDDWAARRESQRFKLQIQGTLGVLGLAARRKLIDLPQAITRLRTTNFRMSEELVASILDEATRYV
jgi:predicted nucleic acid-binding protein